MPVIAPPLAISPEDLHTLGQWSRSGSLRAALLERAKLLLLAAEAEALRRIRDGMFVEPSATFLNGGIGGVPA